MRGLLKQYLVLAMIVQFLLACLLDFAGLCFGSMYRSMLGRGVELPDSTAFVVSIRHWAFAWPIAVLVFAAVLFRKKRADEIFTHFFAGMTLVAIVLLMIASYCFFVPIFYMETNTGN
jgi:hypothetical protein